MRSFTGGIAPEVRSVAERAICITGNARSGTTILATLVHSFAGVECAFEPPALIHAFYYCNSYDPVLWQSHYAHYLVEEILAGAVSGRNLNFRAADWSSVFRAKSLDELRARFTDEGRFAGIRQACDHHRVAFKIPNITRHLRFLSRSFPGSSKVVSIRSPDEVVASLTSRGWYRREKSEYWSSGILRETAHGPLPAFLDEAHAKIWQELDETSRCYLVYCEDYGEEHLTEDCIVVDYQRLCEEPRTVVTALADRLDASPTNKTYELITTLRRSERKGTFAGGQPAARARAWELYNHWKAHAIGRAPDS